MTLLPPCRSRRARHGFTLVELMISLVMGLIVALAAVGLARTATNTFHEQARSSLTEMGVRSAAERLRQDLMRISYMSTGNIALDPKVAHIAGKDAPLERARYSTDYDTIVNLQGIHINVGGSKAASQGTLNLASENLLNPDQIEITGNLTTDDEYSGTLTSGGSCTNGQRVRLDPQADAAVYALVGGDAGASTLTNAKNAFQPVAATEFLARVTDPMGCHHYVPVCDVTVENAGGNDIVIVHLRGDSKRAVLYSHSAANEYENPPGMANNCGASEGGKVTIAPVQRVRWALTPSPAYLSADPAVEPVGNKFDITRQWIDAKGAIAGNPEIIAEYAVDLKFGITAYDQALALGGNSGLRVFDMDSDPGTGNIVTTTRPASSTLANSLGPQHVRSVRFRVATRTSQADRQADIVVGPGRTVTDPYMSRYCVDKEDLASCKKFARVRTIVSEVALQNQARMFY